jgi:hypothetical protein
MKIPLHREDQTKISFKIELNGSKLLYHNHQKEKEKNVARSLKLSQL